MRYGRSEWAMVRSGDEARLWSATVRAMRRDLGTVVPMDVSLDVAFRDRETDTFLLHRGYHGLLPKTIVRSLRVDGASGAVLRVPDTICTIDGDINVEFRDVHIIGAFYVTNTARLKLSGCIVDGSLPTGPQKVIEVFDGAVVMNDNIVLGRGSGTAVYIHGGNPQSRIVSLETDGVDWSLSVYNGDGQLWACVTGLVQVRTS